MINIQNRIDTLLKATESWFSSDNDYLADAIDRSVQEGYFSFQDVQFALDALQNSIHKEALEQWIHSSGLDGNTDAGRENVLCLHAGNLPLVGFQDAFATLLSGARYTGKISRKDPYLLPTFLNEVKKTALWTDRDVQWTHRLDDFEDMRHNRIMFAGSESSVPDVKEAIQQYHLAKDDAKFLIRTAHFSMAYFDENDEDAMQDLAEGILRYGGKGCRSIAVVVSPFPLEKVKTELRDKFEGFWRDNPQHQNPPAKLNQQYAYNEAVGRNQLWLEYFLLQEGGMELDQDFICYWIEGDENKAAELFHNFSNRLQSVYVTHPNKNIPDCEQQTELLSHAQKPPIFWQPDGVETLKWLLKEE